MLTASYLVIALRTEAKSIYIKNVLILNTLLPNFVTPAPSFTGFEGEGDENPDTWGCSHVAFVNSHMTAAFFAFAAVLGLLLL